MDQLKERLATLANNLAEELAGKKDPRYIEDLQDSIKGVERELGFMKKHPNGVQMVKG